MTGLLNPQNKPIPYPSPIDFRSPDPTPSEKLLRGWASRSLADFLGQYLSPHIDAWAPQGAVVGTGRSGAPLTQEPSPRLQKPNQVMSTELLLNGIPRQGLIGDHAIENQRGVSRVTSNPFSMGGALQRVIYQLSQAVTFLFGIQTLPGRFIDLELDLDGLHGGPYVKILIRVWLV